jgi:hypothetical protein
VSVQFFPVEVEFDVQRTVYVKASTEAEARKLALDARNWVDAEDPHEMMDTLRLVAS